jgi:hypothetical protein
VTSTDAMCASPDPRGRALRASVRGAALDDDPWAPLLARRLAALGSDRGMIGLGAEGRPVFDPFLPAHGGRVAATGPALSLDRAVRPPSVVQLENAAPSHGPR